MQNAEIIYNIPKAGFSNLEGHCGDPVLAKFWLHQRQRDSVTKWYELFFAAWLS